MKNIRKCFMAIVGVCTILVIIIFIPILLNFVLQCNISRYSIIGDSSGPSIWLGFWGTYLAAIGSIIMAVVAVRSDRKTRAQYARKTEYDVAKLEYDIFEAQIISDIKLYSVLRFTTIYRLLNNDDISTSTQVQYKLFQELQLSSIVAVKYEEDQSIKEYVQILCKYNQTFLKYSEQVKILLIDYEEGVLSKEMLKEKIYVICKKVDIFCENTTPLSSVGFDALLKKNAEVIQLLKEVNA